MMRKGWILAGAGGLLALLLGYAWIDGGREPVRTIVEPIRVPEMLK